MRNVFLVYARVLLCAGLLAACGDDEGQMPDDQAGTGAGTGGGAGLNAAGTAGGTAGAGGMGGSAEPFAIGGACQRTGPTREELAGMLEPIAGATSVSDLTQTAMGLHWVSGGVKRLGADGTSVETVVMGQVSGPLASNAGTLAWLGDAEEMFGVVAVPLGSSGATPALVAPSSSFATLLVLDETHAYYDGTASDGLVRAPLPSGEPTVIAMPFGVQALRVDGGFVYFAEGLGEYLMRVPTSGGEPEQVSPPGGLVHTFVMDATHFYISGNIGIRRVQRSDQMSVLLMRHKQASSAISNSIQELVDDGDRLVFADRLDNIGWVMKDGSDCGYIGTTTLTESPATYHTAIALDAEYLYVAADRALHRIARSAVGLE